MKKGFVKRNSFLAIAALVLIVGLSGPLPAVASEKYLGECSSCHSGSSTYDLGTNTITSDWTDLGIWSDTIDGLGGAGMPGPGDHAYLYLNQPQNLTINFDDLSGITLGALTVDSFSAGTLTLSMAPGGGDLSALNETIGYDGTGTFDQSGGTNDTDDLFLGSNSTGDGTYNLSGDSTVQFLVDDDEIIGVYGTGEFNQSGGEHHTSNLYFGFFDGSSGNYNLSGGELWVHTSEYIGFYGTGTGEFNQSGGTHHTLNLYLGYTGGDGTYILSGGELWVHTSEYIGFYGTGEFNQSGGTHSVSNALVLGNHTDSTGTYNLSGTGNLYVAGNEEIGSFGTGVFNQTGGTHIALKDLSLGVNSDIYGTGDGTYNLSGGTLEVRGDIVNGAGTGTLNIDGGTLTVVGGGSIDVDNFNVGNESGSDGSFTLNAGDSLTAGYETIGYDGTGEFNQDGGTNTVTGTLYLGYNSDALGTYNLSGTGALLAYNEYIGRDGTGTYDLVTGDLIQAGGTFNQSGGTNTVGNYLFIGEQAGSSGIYNLSGDSTVLLSVDWHELIGYYGTGEFNQSGGTHTVRNDLYLGFYVDSSGTYNLTGGTLDISGDIVNSAGWGIGVGTGTLNIDGGTLTMVGGGDIDVDYFRVGNAVGTTGSHTLTAGDSITAFQEDIGNYGTGTLTQTGGTNTVGAYNLGLGRYVGSSGTYNLSGDSSVQLSVTGSEFIGGSATGTYDPVTGDLLQAGGTFNQDGGTNTVGYLLSIAVSAGSTGEYNLSGGALSAKIERIGYWGTGVFNQTGGTNTILYDAAILNSGNLYLGYQSGSSGIYNLSGDSTVQLSANSEFIGNYGSGEFNQSGGTNTVTNTLTIARYGSADGTYDLSGGTLTVQNGGGTAELINNDTFNFSGGTLNADIITNNANFNLSGTGTRTVNGDFTNTGTVKVTDTTAVFTGTYTELGAFVSDPSDVFFTDLIVGDSGYMVGGVGDNFFISGDFTNNSTQGALWNTVDAYLAFTGAGTHEFYMAGWTDPESYGWGTLELLGGGDLTLTGGTGGTLALYVSDLILSAGAILDLGGYDLYYSGLFAGSFDSITGGTVTYTGGTTSVPEPSTMLLLMFGLMGLMVFHRRQVIRG